MKLFCLLCPKELSERGSDESFIVNEKERPPLLCLLAWRLLVSPLKSFISLFVMSRLIPTVLLYLFDLVFTPLLGFCS